MEVPEDLVHNWLCDLKKKNINQFERAKIIKLYMKEKSLSGRGFAKEFGIPKSSVEDWLLWLKLSEVEYIKYIEEGKTHTDIYRALRNNRDLTSSNLFNIDNSIKYPDCEEPYLSDDFPDYIEHVKFQTNESLKKIRDLTETSSIKETELDLMLWRLNFKLNQIFNSFPPKTEKTIDLIYELKSKIKVLEDHYQVKR